MALVTVIIVWLMVTRSDFGWVGVAIGLFQIIIGGYIASDTITKPKKEGGL